MAYIGKSPQGSGVRQRYYFTQTSGGATSISGTDDDGRTFKFTDGEYVDVYLNGVLLVHGTDYGTGTANTISSLAALANGDVVEIVVYDIFNVAKINNEAVRKRYYKTASGSETSISGADNSGATITFPANAEIEVKLNGVSLVQGTDYNTSTANTVGGLSALSAGQVVEIVVYERFVLGDTVSKADGGTFAKPVGIDGDGTAPLTVDRATSDGDAIIIQKDGTQTGAITTNGDDTVEIYGEGSAKTGLRFGGSSLIPLKNAGALSDNGVDLGTSSYRFNDAYLGGNLYIGGTGSANALEDYEEGTWTATMIGTTSNPSTAITATAHYTKIGRLVYLSCRFIGVDTTGAAGGIRITGNPFSIANGAIATGNVMVHKRFNASASNTVNIAPYVDTTYIAFYLAIHNSPWAEITHNPGNDHYLIFTAVFHV